MAIKNVRSERVISDMHQLDPAFYEKIMSRSSISLSHQNSVHRCPGKVPFVWEIQPGTPKDASNFEIFLPVRFPPPIQSSNMPLPTPCITPTGPKAYFFKKVDKIKNLQIGLPPAVRKLRMPKPNISLQVKKIKNIQIGLSSVVRELSIHKPNISFKDARTCVLSNIKKAVHRLKIHNPNISIKDVKPFLSRNIKKKATKIKNICLNKKNKSKHPETNNYDSQCSEFYFDDYTASPTSSGNSFPSPLSSSSSPRHGAITSPQIITI